uniref:Uncharacterized protein n=1 Tax=Candidatus Kentrum sp. TUN TaxID=2126343 RepID=A0A450ZCQ6_9GAMM|nr:MAG: hypothetical protein BECKTUN1418E_GA0071001_100247 [Candidatus Kentron sp. TUN]VFK51518.1 MAG: hypothetical protein BECKTUN1418F_GA0071002_100245 [Candidatus Kentron sp. TUN]
MSSLESSVGQREERKKESLANAAQTHIHLTANALIMNDNHSYLRLQSKSYAEESFLRYRKNKNFGELVRVSESHPLSALARSANMFIYFPLGFTNESNFKSGVLIQNHIWLV